MTLIVLAAGLGSRFGGPKQFFQLGPNGECLFHYSLYSAIKIGCNNLLLVTREEILPQAQKATANLPIEVQIVLQKTPNGKPRGTADALLTALKASDDSQFIVINADDYYGRESFQSAENLLKRDPIASAIPYFTKNTLSPHGGVSRAICQLENNRLTKIQETHQIVQQNGEASGILDGKPIKFSLETPVSMNFFTFSSQILPDLEPFVKNAPAEKEITIPDFLNSMIETHKYQVPVEISKATWFGMTYAEDLNEVKPRLENLHHNNVFPRQLW